MSLKDFGRNNHLVMVALFIWALGEGLWLNLRQLYLVELGATPAQVGSVLALEAAARAVLPVIAGYVADRIGPYRVMVVSWVMGVVGVVMLVLAQSWPMAIPGLVIYAMSAFAIPVISTYALLSLPDRRLVVLSERVLTTVYAPYFAGMIISPLLGGLLANRLGIRANMLIATAVFALSTVVVLFAQHIEPEPPEDPAPGSRWLDLFGNRRFLWLLGYFVLVVWILQTGYALAPNYLEDTRGLSLSTIGLFYSLSALGTLIFNLVAGRFPLRWGFPSLLLVIMAAMGGVWLLPSTAGVGAAFFMLGALSTGRQLMAAGLSRVVRPENRGFAFGALESLISVAAGLAAQAAGQLYGLTTAHDLPLIVSLAGAPVLFALWFAVRPGRSKLAAAESGAA